MRLAHGLLGRARHDGLRERHSPCAVGPRSRSLGPHPIDGTRDDLDFGGVRTERLRGNRGSPGHLTPGTLQHHLIGRLPPRRVIDDIR